MSPERQIAEALAARLFANGPCGDVRAKHLLIVEANGHYPVGVTQSGIVNQIVAALTAERTPPSAQDEPRNDFQARVNAWVVACFGADIARDVTERNHRFIEEALELVQASGCTAAEAHQLVDYVYGRPAGEMAQELGGVMVTLAALCTARGLCIFESAETELVRVWGKVETIRAKQAAKPKHSPLPAAPSPPPSDPPTECDLDDVAVRVPTPSKGKFRVVWTETYECPTHGACAMLDGLCTVMDSDGTRCGRTVKVITPPAPPSDPERATHMNRLRQQAHSIRWAFETVEPSSAYRVARLALATSLDAGANALDLLDADAREIARLTDVARVLAHYASMSPDMIIPGGLTRDQQQAEIAALRQQLQAERTRAEQAETVVTAARKFIITWDADQSNAEGLDAIDGLRSALGFDPPAER